MRNNAHFRQGGGRSTDQMPSMNVDVEEGLLGAILHDPDCLDQVVVITKPDEFVRDVHQRLARVIWDLYEAGSPIDPIVVCDVLKRDSTFDDLGGDIGISNLMERGEVAASAPKLAGIIHEHYRCRLIREYGNMTAERSCSRTMTSDEQFAQAQADLLALDDQRTKRNVITLGEARELVLERIKNPNPEAGGIPTGWSALNRLIGGLRSKQLIVVAGRTSMGKSSFAVGLLQNIGIKLGRSMLYVEVESGSTEVTQRAMAMVSGVKATKLIQTNLLTDNERALLIDTSSRFPDHPVSFLVSDKVTPAGICAEASRIKKKIGLELIIVDYLQLVAPDVQPGKREKSRQEDVAGMMRGFKDIARQLDVPVVVLSQLNREPENRKDRRPRLADLRESGSIENDADVVILIHRPSYYNPNDKPGVAEIAVAKQRNGPTGVFELVWRAETSEFVSLSNHDDDEVSFGDAPAY